jgi:hypothetical protein
MRSRQLRCLHLHFLLKTFIFTFDVDGAEWTEERSIETNFLIKTVRPNKEDPSKQDIQDFYENGKLKSRWTYNEGAGAEGPFKDWYDNGNPKREGTYNKYGEYVGPYKEWHENGNLMIDGTYNGEDNFEGHCTEWYENGNLNIDGTCDADGKYVGIVQKGYEDDGKTETYLALAMPNGDFKPLPEGSALKAEKGEIVLDIHAIDRQNQEQQKIIAPQLKL